MRPQSCQLQAAQYDNADQPLGSPARWETSLIRLPKTMEIMCFIFFKLNSTLNQQQTYQSSKKQSHPLALLAHIQHLFKTLLHLTVKAFFACNSSAFTSPTLRVTVTPFYRVTCKKKGVHVTKIHPYCRPHLTLSDIQWIGRPLKRTHSVRGCLCVATVVLSARRYRMKGTMDERRVG